MFKISRLYSILLVVMFLFFLFAAKIELFLNLDIEGIEYYVWIVFAFIILLLKSLQPGEFYLKKSYLVLLIVFILFLISNYFYVDVPIARYLMGSFFTLLFIFNYILFYNIVITKEQFFKILKIFVITISAVAVFAYLERIFIDRIYQSYTLRGVQTFLKDPSFLATFLNINIVFCLVLFMMSKNKIYLFLVVFSLITIAMLLFIKALFSAVIICYFFIRYFYHSAISKSITYFLSIFFFSTLIFFGQPLLAEIKYKLNMYFGEGYSVIPRNALYIASFKIATDNFPFGSGQGTFGSIPIKKEYSQIYYDYNLNNVHGLSPEDTLGLTDSQFVFDTHWSSILGELGFIAAIIYMSLWLMPMVSSISFLKSKIIETKLIAFVIVMVFLDIFIESIAAPLPGQLQFIMIYAGLCASGNRILRSQITT